MKEIKNFKYINTHIFSEYVDGYGYDLADAVGYSLFDKKQYRGNIFKTYVIYFNDHDHTYFKVVYFKSLNEYRQSVLGFCGNKLLRWFQNANIVTCKDGKKIHISPF